MQSIKKENKTFKVACDRSAFSGSTFIRNVKKANNNLWFTASWSFFTDTSKCWALGTQNSFELFISNANLI